MSVYPGSNLVQFLKANPLAHQLGRNSMWSLSQAIVTMIITFSVFRHLIAEEGTGALGLWSLTVGAIAFARLADLSGGNALVRLLAIGDEKQLADHHAATIDTVTIFTAALYVILAALMFWPASLYLVSAVAPEFQTNLPLLVPCALLCLIGTSVAGTLGSALDGLHRADLRSIANILSQLVFGALSFWLIPRFGVLGIALAQLIQCVILAGACRWMLVSRVFNLRWFPRLWRQPVFYSMLNYGMRLQLLSLSGLIFDPLTRILINHFAGVSVLGIYEIAYRVVGQSRQLIIAATTPFMPTFSAREGKDNLASTKLIKKLAVVVTVASGLGFSSLILTAPIASLLFLNEISQTMTYSIIILAAGYFFNTLAVPMYLFAQSTNTLRWNTAGQLLIAFLACFSTSIFVQILDSSKIAAGIGIALAIGSMISLLGNCRYYGFSLKDVISIRLTAAMTISIMVSAALGELSKQAFQ